MALSYTQKTSDKSLITKYVRICNSTPFLVFTHTACVDRNPCTNSSGLTSSRTGCTWGTSFPPTVSLAGWGIRRTSPLRCTFCMGDPVDSPTYDLDPTSSSSLSSQSRLLPRFSEFLGTTKRVKILTYVFPSLSITETQLSCLLQNVATSYLTQWQDIALSSDRSHYTLSYGNNPS